MRSIPTRILVEISLCVALAVVLNALTLLRMPYGGTVSLVMLPIIVIALRRGLLAGVTTGILYGLIELMIDPVIVHPFQVVLDYVIAFGAVGVAGIFRSAYLTATGTNSRSIRGLALLFLAVFVPSALRYCVHVVSGYIFFAQYAPPSQPALLYSALYNLFVPVSAIGVFAAAALTVPTLLSVSLSRAKGGHGGQD